jgi:hypothetical protein
MTTGWKEIKGTVKTNKNGEVYFILWFGATAIPNAVPLCRDSERACSLVTATVVCQYATKAKEQPVYGTLAAEQCMPTGGLCFSRVAGRAGVGRYSYQSSPQYIQSLGVEAAWSMPPEEPNITRVHPRDVPDFSYEGWHRVELTGEWDIRPVDGFAPMYFDPNGDISEAISGTQAYVWTTTQGFTDGPDTATCRILGQSVTMYRAADHYISDYLIFAPRSNLSGRYTVNGNPYVIITTPGEISVAIAPADPNTSNVIENWLCDVPDLDGDNRMTLGDFALSARGSYPAFKDN